MQEKFGFPKTLPWGHLIQKGEYSLVKSIVDGKKVYAFYEKDVGFGFKHGIEISSVNIPDNPNTWDKPLIQVKTLSGNTFGKGTYLIIREDYYHDIQEAIDALQGKTRVYKPKRKSESIRSMTEQQIKEHCVLK